MKKTDKAVPSGTGEIREPRPKTGNKKPPLETRFTSTRQPDFKKRKKRIQEKNFTRSVLKEMLKLPYKFPLDARKIKTKLEKAFGKEIVNNSPAGVIMILQQMQKAIYREDTAAFTALMNQAFGMPKMEVELPPKKMIIEIVHDDSEIIAGGKSDIFPVGEN